MKKLLLVFASFVYGLTSLLAQQKIPMDTAIHYGKLDNGLTYYIRYNKLPEKRADFYIVQKVGAILEEDSQNGLAHFLEHMAFNGTKNFHGKALINYLETIGAQFGTNLNAYTSLDETVYMLRGIPTVRPSIVDSSILILHDWSSFISLDGDEIDKERGVIREEWRTGANAERRMWKEGNKLKYPGSQYAKRDVIGDTAVINNFSYDTLRAYYKKWYRPDLQGIVIVGDVDVKQTEQTIKRLFADIPKPVNAAKRIIYTIPDNQEPIVSIVTDREASVASFDIEYKHKPLPDAQKISEEGYNLNLVNSLISAMLNNRFEKLKRNAACPFVTGYSYYGDITRSSDAFIMGVVAKEGQEKPALESLLKEIERTQRYGFTQPELDRAIEQMLANYEKAYNERDKEKSSSYVQEYMRNFLELEPIPGIAWEYNYAKKALKEKINLQLVNKIVQSYITNNNMIVDISAPQKAGVKLPTETEVRAAITDARKNYVEPYKDKKIDKPLLAKKPKAGTITKEQKNDVFGTTEWQLSNGIKVIFKNTNFKNDEILFTAFSDGGTSLVEKAADLPSAKLADDIIGNNGLGKFSKLDLNQILSGKNVSISTDINTYSENVNGSSSVKDFETLLKLTYLTFTAPRKDEMAYAAYMQELQTSLANANTDPRKTFKDTLSMVLSNHSPRAILMNLETLKKVDQDKAYAIYKQRFANPADFTFVFVGSINLDSIKPYILSYLGGLKTTKNHETWKDNNVRYPSGKLVKDFDKEMQVERTSVYLFQWGGMPFNLTNRVNMAALADIMDIRYTESLREDEGGTYGTRVDGSVTNQPQEQAMLGIRFDTNPKQADKLISIAKQELDSVALVGPRKDDLDKVKKNLLKRYNENQKENNWWKSAIILNEQDKINMVSDYEKAVNQITAESIKQTLKALLIQQNSIEFKMNPKSTK
ncbi:MAG: insulinase family protein [Paludibacteraceae bacterium]|nr:insulinase family protein [Paludibacteraceae bacterium]